ncbi:MAG: winged helix-turn-helix domain-containing protein [Lachnospiraceae bacterium]|nr:winged helix-turn-helix domain-containing protein [Lachnospiraceae bacterium]
MLAVNSLGKFELTDGKQVLNDENLRSDMLKKLLVYLLTHREHPITIQELSDALWQEDEIDNPAGALKNLMYRLRAILKKNISDASFVITCQGAYAWNAEIEVNLDIERFEEYYKIAKASSDIQEITQNLESAVALYKGEFLENSLDQHWAVTLSTYYHSMFLNAVKTLLQLYLDAERFQDAEDVSVYALRADSVDEELHCFYITALIRENKYDLAMKRYEDAVRILHDALGVRNPAKLQKVQNELLQMSKGRDAEALENIHDDMVEEEESVGVYFCGYPVFREIYRLEVRKNTRLKEAEHIVLFTLEAGDNVKFENDKMKSFVIEQGMKYLKNTLRKVLRIGDVAARYSDSQYIVLLPTCTYESCMSVTKRVLACYATMDKRKKVSVKTEFEQLSGVNSSLVR